MIDWLAAQTKTSAQKIFFSFEQKVYPYAEVNESVAYWSAHIKNLGVKRKDVIGVLLSNSPDFVFVCFAVMRLGAILLPLNTRLNEAELEYQLKKTKATLLVTSQDFFTRGLEAVVPCYLVEDGLDKTLEPIKSAQIKLEQSFCIMFTSGTTGKPKGVCLNLGNFFYSATASAYRLGLEVNDNWLCAMPLYHVGGLSILLRSCLYGTCVSLHARFELGRVTASLMDESQGITLVSLVPTMLYRIVQQADFKPSSSLRLVLLGGASASYELLRQARAHDLNVVTTYGLTEACSQVATMSPCALPLAQGRSSVGKALMFTEVKICDAQGKPLAAGEVGEILVRGPSIMQAYFEDEAATQKTLQKGWLHTGDIGYLDDDFNLYVEARRTDLIVSGGENVYPSEVEDVLEQHSSIDKVAVIGLPNAEWGEQVTAVVVLKTQVEQQEDLIAAFEQLCKKGLAAYKRPREYIFVASLPMTASGKIMHQTLKMSLLKDS